MRSCYQRSCESFHKVTPTLIDDSRGNIQSRANQTEGITTSMIHLQGVILHPEALHDRLWACTLCRLQGALWQVRESTTRLHNKLLPIRNFPKLSMGYTPTYHAPCSIIKSSDIIAHNQRPYMWNRWWSFSTTKIKLLSMILLSMLLSIHSWINVTGRLLHQEHEHFMHYTI